MLLFSAKTYRVGDGVTAGRNSYPGRAMRAGASVHHVENCMRHFKTLPSAGNWRQVGYPGSEQLTKRYPGMALKNMFGDEGVKH
eukprot:315964-Rhodomonas_salina.2